MLQCQQHLFRAFCVTQIFRNARSGPKKLTKTHNKGFPDPNHSTLINYDQTLQTTKVNFEILLVYRVCFQKSELQSVLVFLLSAQGEGMEGLLPYISHI